MQNKKTAVDWIEERLKISLGEEIKDLRGFFVLAKEQEMEQIMDAFQEGKWDWENHLKNGVESKDPAQYYNENYKSK